MMLRGMGTAPKTIFLNSFKMVHYDVCPNPFPGFQWAISYILAYNIYMPYYKCVCAFT